MLLPLKLGPVRVNLAGYVPPLVRPLLEAAERGDDLAPLVDETTRYFGFDSIMYGVSAARKPSQESKQYVYTNLPLAWVREYDQKSYLEIDMRVENALTTSLPLIWDQASERGRSARRDQFLDDALRNGVGSGVAFSIRDTRARSTLMAFNSRSPVVDDATRKRLEEMLGDMVLWGTYLHEAFILKIIEGGVAGAAPLIPITQGAGLSPRELEILALLGEGKKTKAMAQVLKIAPGTVQLHLDSIRSKLGVDSRIEALNLARDRGLIPPSR